jgi:hypothetical protein
MSKVFPAIHISFAARSSFHQLCTLIWMQHGPRVSCKGQKICTPEESRDKQASVCSISRDPVHEVILSFRYFLRCVISDIAQSCRVE